jgi:hypothetical protein
MNIYKLITYTLAIASASHQALSSQASNENERTQRR